MNGPIKPARALCSKILYDVTMSDNQKRRRFQIRRRQQKQSRKPNYAFIDAQNLNLGTQRVGWKIDWKKFRQYLRDHYRVENAYLFIGYIPDNEKLYKQMQEAGYMVVLKPTVDMLMTEEELKDEKHVTKGNVDAELVLYAMKEYNNYEKAVIVSGDGDFFCIAEYLEKQQKLLNILTPNSHFSSLYKPFEQYTYVLDRVKGQLAYAYVRRGRKKKK